MHCDTCFPVDIQECPDYLAIDAGLAGSTKYRWQIKDKFGTVYIGLAQTDATGVLYIPVADSDTFPSGFFMHFSGAFKLTAFEYISETGTQPATFSIDDALYDCIELRPVKYVGDADDDSPVTTPATTLPPIHAKGNVVIGGPEYANYEGLILAFRDGTQFNVKRDGSAADREINYDATTGLFTYPTDVMELQPEETTDIYFL